MENRQTWLIVGASRGIGLEFVRQLLASGHDVVATQRSTSSALAAWQATPAHADRLKVLQCDVTSETSIEQCAAEMTKTGLNIDHAVINAGVLNYPNHACEMSFETFDFHLRTNTIGPIVMAKELLKLRQPPRTIVFMSSDSGSTTNFLDMEDGFAAYAASKAALNQALRHMAAELKRKGSQTTILALHPGEVATDMQNIDVTWEVKGVISAKESVSAMLHVIGGKGVEDSGSFWTWENKRYPW